MNNAYKNYFPLPNVIFSLNLSPGEIAVYSYLLYCEDRKTYQCYPSYKAIGRAVGMSTNTVQKYIAALGEKGFISIESTSVITKSGQKRNGTLDRWDNLKSPSVMLATTRLLHHMSRIFQEQMPAPPIPSGIQIDRKRLAQLREKKIAMGHKADDHEEYHGPSMSM